MSEPQTEAGKALLNDIGKGYKTMLRHVLAIEEQAATEARRELLAKVEGLRREYVSPPEQADSIDAEFGTLFNRIAALLAPSEKGARG